MNIGVLDNLSKIHKKICYNPEMIRQGSIIEDFENPKYIIIGAFAKEEGEQLANIWKKVHNKPIYFVSPVEAEIIKIALNVSFTMSISYANIIGDLCEKFNANSNNVLDVVYKDRRNYKPGLGFMGPCFPRDVLHFRRVSLENSIESGYLFSFLLSELNQQIVDKYIIKIKSLKKKNIGVFGIAYKPNSPYIFESQPIKIIQEILNNSNENQYNFFIFDPIAEDKAKEYFKNKNINFCSTSNECLEKSDIIFIGTANYSNIQTEKPIINPWVKTVTF